MKNVMMRCRRRTIMFILSLALLSCLFNSTLTNLPRPTSSPGIHNEPAKVQLQTQLQLQPQLQPRRQLTVRFLSRLGNQLFDLANGFGIARENNRDFRIPCFLTTRMNSLLNTFPHLTSIPCVWDVANFTEITTMRWAVFEPKWFDLTPTDKDVLLVGFYQSYKYFVNVAPQIRHLLEFSSSIQDDVSRVLRNLTADGVKSVGIHVRRGDYTIDALINQGYALPNQSYFAAAINYFRKRLDKPRFIVVSEELDWCRENINGNDVVYHSFDDAYMDMCLLSKADHIIISSGTYSWWSAFLNGGSVVYFRDIVRQGSGLAFDFIPDDFFPPHWITM